MYKTTKRKLIDRSIIFGITLFGFLFFIIFDLGFSYVYRIDGYNDLQWLAYWTHLSNLAALLWITLAFISILTNNEKLEGWINHWNIKNSIFTFIITTGLVFIAVAYVPVVIDYSTPGNVEDIQNLVVEMAIDGQLTVFGQSQNIIQNEFSRGEIFNYYNNLINIASSRNITIYNPISGGDINIDPTPLYRSCVIIGTTFKHVIIPGMFIYLAFTEIGYFRTKNIDDTKRTMIQFIWPCLYLIYVLLFCSVGLFMPPYPVLDYGFTYSFYAMDESMQYLWVVICIILDLVMGAIFICTSLLQNKWNRFVIREHNKKQESIN